MLPLSNSLAFSAIRLSIGLRWGRNRVSLAWQPIFSFCSPVWVDPTPIVRFFASLGTVVDVLTQMAQPPQQVSQETRAKFQQMREDIRKLTNALQDAESQQSEYSYVYSFKNT